MFYVPRNEQHEFKISASALAPALGTWLLLWGHCPNVIRLPDELLGPVMSSR